MITIIAFCNIACFANSELMGLFWKLTQCDSFLLKEFEVSDNCYVFSSG